MRRRNAHLLTFTFLSSITSDECSTIGDDNFGEESDVGIGEVAPSGPALTDEVNANNVISTDKRRSSIVAISRRGRGSMHSEIPRGSTRRFRVDEIKNKKKIINKQAISAKCAPTAAATALQF